MTGAGFAMRRMLVVGGGLGHRLACQAVDRGHRALSVSRIAPTKLSVDHLSMNLADRDDWVRAVEAGRARLGGAEVLVTCPTASLRRMPLTQVPDDEWLAAIREAVLCPLAACNRGLDILRSGSAIMNLTAVRPTPTDSSLAPASAAFTAVEAMTRALSGPASGRGVQVFGVAPGRRHEPPPRPVTARMPLLALEDAATVVDRLLDLIDQPPESGTTVQLVT